MKPPSSSLPIPIPPTTIFPLFARFAFFLFLSQLPCTWAAVGDSCSGSDATASGGLNGRCEAVGDCAGGSGFTITNACPNDPVGIKCCITKSCTSTTGQAGTCLNNPGSGSTCSGGGGTFITGRCPGPNDVQCCIGVPIPVPIPGPAVLDPTPPPAPAAEDQDVVIDFWIKAFIPLTVPGITLPYPQDPTAKSMIPGIPVIGDCFLTDQRTFDPSRGASARMTSEAFIWIRPDGFNWSETHHCGESTEVDCEDGDVEATKTQSNDHMSFVLQRGSSDSVVLSYSAARNNPLVAFSPDIDLTGTLTVDRVGKYVEFVGLVDEFPAFEAYVSINGGDPETIRQLLPEGGVGPEALFGKAGREFRGRIDF